MKILLFSILCFYFGIGLASVLDFPFLSANSLAIIFLTGCFVAICNSSTRFVILPLSILIFAFWRVQIFEDNLPIFQEEWREETARIIDEPDRRVDNQKLVLDWGEGAVLASVSLYENYEYGDLVRVSGYLTIPTSDGDFDYAAYLSRFRVGGLMERPSIVLMENGPPSLRRFLSAFNKDIEQRLNLLFFEPESGFVRGLLLGSRAGMPEDMALAFQVSGLTHIVAISGSNMSLLVMLFFSALRFLPLSARLFVSGIGIFAFMILVGAGAAVFRAGIMGLLNLLALYSGRKAAVFFVMLWTGALMLLINPYVLVLDVGFQLSFMATIGLLVFSGPLGKLFPDFSDNWKLEMKNAFILTIAAQIATLPFMMLHFGRISMVAPFSNLFIAPFLPLAMLFSALALLFGLPFVLPATLFLKVIEYAAVIFAKPSFADLPFQINPLIFWILIAIFSYWVWVLHKQALLRAFASYR